MKFFIDSNIIIEALKKEGLKEAREIMGLLVERNIIPSLNFTVINEIIYTISFKRKLIKFEVLLDFLFSFERLETTRQVEDLALNYMGMYNLRPNDALILATCRHYNIRFLLSLDEDFETACTREGIFLINKPEKLDEAIDQRS